MRNLTKDELKAALVELIRDPNFVYVLLDVLWENRNENSYARLHKALEDEIVSMEEGN